MITTGRKTKGRGMEWGTIAGLVTALMTMITAVLGFVVSRNARAAKKELTAVHNIVNQNWTDSQNFQRALIRALNEAGVAVPIDQSLPPDLDGDEPRG